MPLFVSYQSSTVYLCSSDRRCEARGALRGPLVLQISLRLLSSHNCCQHVYTQIKIKHDDLDNHPKFTSDHYICCHILQRMLKIAPAVFIGISRFLKYWNLLHTASTQGPVERCSSREGTKSVKVQLQKMRLKSRAVPARRKS